MFYFIALDSGSDILLFAFVLKLRGVDSDNKKRTVFILLFQPLEVRDHMNTVYAAVSPEIKQHDIPFEIL